MIQMPGALAPSCASRNEVCAHARGGRAIKAAWILSA